MRFFDHHRLRVFWVVCLVFLISSWACQHFPQTHTGKTFSSCRVMSIHDADTLRIRCGGAQQKIRLYCIDAPEMAQRPWGKESRDALREWLPRGTEFSVRAHGRDRYGRTIGEVILEGEKI